MRPEAAKVMEGAEGMICNRHTNARCLIVGCVDVHPHYKLAGVSIVQHLGPLQNIASNQVGVLEWSQSQTCKQRATSFPGQLSEKELHIHPCPVDD